MAEVADAELDELYTGVDTARSGHYMMDSEETGTLKRVTLDVYTIVQLTIVPWMLFS